MRRGFGCVTRSQDPIELSSSSTTSTIIIVIIIVIIVGRECHPKMFLTYPNIRSIDPEPLVRGNIERSPKVAVRPGPFTIDAVLTQIAVKITEVAGGDGVQLVSPQAVVRRPLSVVVRIGQEDVRPGGRSDYSHRLEM